jgi:hypothetical protein
VKHSYELAKELNFDMADYWEPGAKGFVSSMKKGQMLKELTEAGKTEVIPTVEIAKRVGGVLSTATALKGLRSLPAFLKPANDNKKKGKAA